MQGGAISTPKVRVRILDALRGFSVVSMVCYHTMFDLVYMYGVDIEWYDRLPGYLWQQSICWVFILVAGASLHYSSRRFKHAFIVLGCAAVLTVGTALLMPGMLIAFGVLHMYGVSMLLAALLWKPLQKVPPAAGFAVCAALFVLLRSVPDGGIGILDWQLAALPEAVYSTPFLFWLGFPGPGFFSSDYFPLVPWTLLFFAGYFGWARLKNHVPATPCGRSPLEYIGRHSLLIYMLHQPLVYGLLELLSFAGVLR